MHIKASDDKNLWADVFDNDMREVFRLQSDLAEQVAQALDITLLEPERQALKAKPTENMEAYEYYLRGNEYFYRSYEENNLSIAIRMYRKAVELDSTFALAYAQLSTAHVHMYWFRYDRSENCLALAKQAVDEALDLNQTLPDAHLALGWYYYHGHLDYDLALKQFEIVRKSQPNNCDLLRGIGAIQSRKFRWFLK